MNLLSDPIFTIPGLNQVSLSAVLAAMARGEIAGFTRLRAHQRPAWHMFLVQLSALALWHGDQDAPPLDEGAWCNLLRSLTPEHPDDAPWQLIGSDPAQPAFLQPPDPGGLKWTPVETADALDMLITARNHDLKQTIAWGGEAEDWVFALVSLQTMEGFGGAGNYGIARMNGGSSSRPMLGLCPVTEGGGVDPSAWWRRDVLRLVDVRDRNAELAVGIPGGLALLWCKPWPEDRSLDVTQLDPWFIEVCRRVRLQFANGSFTALRSTSKGARVDAKAFKGALDDPWCPVHADDAKALTLSGGRFDYRMMHRLMSKEWRLPLLALPRDEDDMILIAEAFARGNSKTEKFRSRTLPVPGDVAGLFATPQVGEIGASQIDDISNADKALRDGLAVMASRGTRDDLKKEHYVRSRPARAQFDADVDAIFFDHLWAQLRVADADGARRYAVRCDFTDVLQNIARRAFEAALPGIPCAALFRPRAEARARKVFAGRLARAFPAQTVKETSNV